MINIKELKELYSKAKKNFEEDTDNQDQIYDFEEELNIALEIAVTNNEIAALKNLKTELQDFKDEHNFFDQEAELDMMFPNRHEEGFDDDDMSYDSVFGGE